MTLQEGSNLFLVLAETGARPTQAGGGARKMRHMAIVRRGSHHRMIEKHEELAVQELRILVKIARSQHGASGNTRGTQCFGRVERIPRRAPRGRVRVAGDAYHRITLRWRFSGDRNETF